VRERSVLLDAVRARLIRTLALFLAVVFTTAIADGSAGPVGEFGGRWVGGGEIRVLDPSVPAILRIDRATLSTRVQLLSGADAPLDPYGLALPGDGTVWVLADRGRLVFRFSEATGERVEKRRLAQPCQGVATFWSRAGFFAVRLRPNEPMLLRPENGALRPFSPIVSRSAPGLPELLIANLVKCGTGTRGAIPCWFVAGESEVLLLDRIGTIRPVAVPSFATPSPARGISRDPGVAFTYPIRDAFLLEGDALWALSNQDGDRTPLEEGARRGRHVTLLRGGRFERTVELPSEGRAILDAGESNLVLLFADGSVGRVLAR
jgi:hypothetical protein